MLMRWANWAGVRLITIRPILMLQPMRPMIPLTCFIEGQMPPYELFHGVANIFRIPKIAGMFFQSQRNPATSKPMANRQRQNAHLPKYGKVTSFQQLSHGIFNVTAFPSVHRKEQSDRICRTPFFERPGLAAGGTLKAVGSVGGLVDQVSPPGTPVKMFLTPKTTILKDCGDMTRIIISLVDTSVCFTGSRGIPFTELPPRGAGDFIGEAKVPRLRCPHFDFYVKTRDCGRRHNVSGERHGVTPL